MTFLNFLRKVFLFHSASFFEHSLLRIVIRANVTLIEI